MEDFGNTTLKAGDKTTVQVLHGKHVECTVLKWSYIRRSGVVDIDGEQYHVGNNWDTGKGIILQDSDAARYRINHPEA